MNWRQRLIHYAGACESIGVTGVSDQLMSEEVSIPEAQKIVDKIFCMLAGYMMAAQLASNRKELTDHIQPFLSMTHDMANCLKRTKEEGLGLLK